MNTMINTRVIVEGNTELFNRVIDEIELLKCDVSDIRLPSPSEVEKGFDEAILTDFGNAIRSLEEAYNGLIIFARCKAYTFKPFTDVMSTADNDLESEV